jgi:hypothetical protein
MVHVATFLRNLRAHPFPNSSTLKEQSMSRKQYSQSKQLVVAAALALATSGVALADDNSMTRFGGESYAAFNMDKPGANNAPAAFRQTNPHGLSIGEYQALSSDGRPWQATNLSDATAIASMDAAKAWRQRNPHGLPISTYEALSADGRPWQLPNSSAVSAVASRDAASGSMGATSEPSGTGLAMVFGFLRTGRAASSN